MNKVICILTFFTQISYSSNLLDKPTPTLSFAENKGQFTDQFYNPRPDVLFGGNDGQLSFFLKNNGISYQLNRIDKVKESEDQKIKEKLKDIELQTFYRIDIKWLNCNTNALIVGGEVISGYNNYYLEQCPNGVINVRSYSDVYLKNIYNKIDLHYYEKNGLLKYDFSIAPYTDYKQIQLEISGAEISLQKDGSLLLKTPLGDIEEQAPVVYQNGKLLKSKYVVNKNLVSFEVENYNPNYTLLIDPVTRIWGTYYGGTGDEMGYSCAIDALDNVYLSGYSNSNVGTLIATTGAHQTTFSGGNWDAFLVKLDGNGVRQWGTYYGGIGKEIGYSCTTDPYGNIFVAGYTDSNSGTSIATTGANQSTYGGGSWDGFLVKFSSTGIRQWATYVGGASEDLGYSCSTDASGNVYMSGTSQSSSAITSTGSHQSNLGGGSDAFLMKFNGSGIYQWGTYYGGSGNESSNSCCTDVSGNVFMSGTTNSSAASSIISSSGSHQIAYGGGPEDAFLVKFDSLGTRQWGTFYGGQYGDNGSSCVADASGNVYLTGRTDSQNGTTIATPGSHQAVAPASTAGPSNAFLAKFDSSGTRLWGTYYGGNGDDHTRSCSTDDAGNVYIAGFTESTSSITSNGHQSAYGGGMWDAYLVKFNSSGVRQWATYYGGSDLDVGYGCSVGQSGEVYLVGGTASMTGTTIATAGSHQDTYNGIAGMKEAYLVKFACEPLGVSIATQTAICEKTSLSFSASVTSTLSINFNWNGPNNFSSSLVSPSIMNASTINSGTYTLQVDDGLGCSEIATTSITVNTLPTISLSSTNTLICLGEEVTLNSSGALNYLWSSGQTSNSISVHPQTTAMYSVTGTDINGCKNTATITLDIAECTHVSSIANNLNENVKIFPNPNNGNFKLELSSFGNVVIINSLGQIIYASSFTQGSHNIAIENNAPGVYHANVYLNNLSHSLRIVIH